MGETYFQGGDAWQPIDANRWGGQTFRIDDPLIIHWIDLNFKYSWTMAYPNLSVLHADSSHLPEGPILSHNSYLLKDLSLPLKDWLWLEPWGKTLNENHYWLEQPILTGPTITFKNGEITLQNTGYTAQWITTMPSVPYLPLIGEGGRHLYFHHYSPQSIGDPVTHWHSYTFRFQKGLEFWYLEGVISLGSQWPAWNSRCALTPLGSSFFEGQGPNILNLTAQWIHCRTFHGLDPDPTGWVLTDFQLRIEDTDAKPGGILTNAYVGIARSSFTPPPHDYYTTERSGFAGCDLPHRVRYRMTPYKLLPDFYYFLRIRSPYADFLFPHHWQYDKDDATYRRGHRLLSEDKGATWIHYWNDDHLFAVFGIPPAPPPPPPPPIDHFAILDIKQTLTLEGYQIVVITNVPCHLYMLWTGIPPRKHQQALYRRGEFWKNALQLCFDVYHKNEQEEPGDTMVHTFIKEPWPVCETRWFTFRYLINNAWGPSVGPIFEKHRAKQPIELICYPDACPTVTTCDGYLRSKKGLATWQELVDGFDVDTVTCVEPLTLTRIIGDHLPNTWYGLQRANLTFNTTSIPPTAKIVSAKLSIYPNYKFDDLNIKPDLCLYRTTPFSYTTLDPSDWSTFQDVPLSQRLLYDEIIIDAYNDFIFLQAGLDAIVKGGITTLGIRNANYDASGNRPPWSAPAWPHSGIRAHSANFLTDHYPRLTILYTL